SGLADVLDHALVPPFAVLDDGRENLDAGAIGPALDVFHDLLGRLRLDALTADRAVGDADARVEQAQVVVNLRHGADGRARVVADTFLVDGDRRGEALNLIDVGLVHLAEELARVGRE